MAINIQNLLDAISSRRDTTAGSPLKAADSDILDAIVPLATNNYNVWAVADSTTGLPTADPTNYGTLGYVTARDELVVSDGSEWVTQTFISSDVIPQPSPLQGETVMYEIGGLASTGAGGANGTLTKMPYSTDTSAAASPSVLIKAYRYGTGAQSSTHGYLMNSIQAIGPGYQTVTKLSFTSDADQSVIGNTTGTDGPAGSRTMVTGITGAERGFDCSYQKIETVQYSNDNIAEYTTNPSLSGTRGSFASITYGYLGTYSFGTQGFTKISTTNSSDITTGIGAFPLGTPGGKTQGSQSTERGYMYQGKTIMQSLPFASETNTSDFGGFAGIRPGSAAGSSQTHGYLTGGYHPITNPYTPGPTGPNPDRFIGWIETFPFASNAPVTSQFTISVTNSNTQAPTNPGAYTVGYYSSGIDH